MHGQLVTGRWFRVLNIVDDVTRECLRPVVGTSISGRRVVRELADLIAERGRPKMVVSDNGTELTSNAVLAWSGDVGIEWHYIAPSKPTANAFIESFNGKFQAECLNQHWFHEPRRRCSKMRGLAQRLQRGAANSAIGNKPPISLVNRSAAHGPPLPVGAG